MTQQPSNHSRRSFLKKFAAGASAFAVFSQSLIGQDVMGPTIDRIQVYPITYPMVSRFKFFEDPEGDLQGRASAVVKITADDGTVGWGESIPVPRWSYETLESVTTTIRNYLAPVLEDHSVYDIAGIHRKMNEAIAPSFSTGQPIAKAGVDIALYDLVGKLTGQSLPQQWGRKPVDEITLSWTLNPRTLDGVEDKIKKGTERGYQHFNIKVGRSRSYDLELSRRVKEHAPEAFLWADANGGLDRVEALQLAPELNRIGVDVLEQPIPHNNLTGYRELKRSTDLPILMDESVVSPSDLIEFIRLDVLDGVAMKIPRCGGILPAKQQIEIVQNANLMFLGSGLTDPGLSLAATLQLYGAFQYEKPAALNGPQFIDQSILAEPIEPENGSLTVPTGPGLGVEVDESRIEDLRVSIK